MKMTEHSISAGLRNLLPLIVAILLLVTCPAVMAQWATNGNNISNTNSGNVGVGTGATAPIEGLHVAKGDANGTVALFQKDTSSSAVAISTTNNKGAVSGTNSNATSVGDLLLNPWGGNLGITNLSPASQLHIGLQADRSSAITYTRSGSSSDGLQINSYNMTSGDGWRRYSDIAALGGQDGTNGGGLLRFLTNPVGSNDAVARMVIAPNGNVGIGTSNPSAMLHLNGGSFRLAQTVGETPFQLYSYANSDSLWFASGNSTKSEIHLSPGYAIDYDRSIAFQYVPGTTGAVAGTLTIGQLAKNNASWTHGTTAFFTAGTERLRITSAGNVGVGLSNPAARLYVAGGSYGAAGNANQNVYALGAQSIAADASIYSYGAICSGNNWGNCASFGGVVLGINNTAAAVNIPNSGNTLFNNGGTVGINTAAPNVAYKLDVNGEINATGLRINGTPISTGSSQWSGAGPIYYTGGNVGIGTNNPTDRLTVYRNDNNAYLRVSAPLSYQSAIGFSDDTNGQDSVIYRPGATRDLAFYTSTAGNVMYLTQAGNLGIGTNAPASNLQIGAQTSTSSASPITLSLGGTYSNSAGANLKLKLYDDGAAANTYGIGVSSGSMDFGVSPTAGYHWYAGGASKMTLANNGDLSVAGNIAAKYQDVAEWVPSSEQFAAGTVVVLDQTKSNQVIASSTAYDTRVAGVISAQPGITLGEKSDSKVLVATTGRVRVKVDASRGPIAIGDLLVTSDVPGVAMKSEALNLGGVSIHRPGTIIGKALEPLPKGKGEILALLSLQ
jgi:hypothetical protein